MALHRQRIDGTFDYAARLQTAVDITATVVGKLSNVEYIFDAGQGRMDARAIVDITGCEVATGNEHYRIYIQGSSSATFATDVWNLGSLELGDSSVSLETVDTVAGRREIAFCNEVNGTVYRYIRAYFFVAGTIDTTGLSIGNIFLVRDA